MKEKREVMEKRLNKKGKLSIKLISIFITLSVLVLLIVAGPVKAFILGLVVSDPDVQKGELISFLASVEIKSSEILDITSLILNLNGPMNVSCRFLPDGTILYGCTGIIIQQIETTNYSYGYGYTEGKLTYNITLNTLYYLAGTYSTEIGIMIREGTITKEGPSVIIRTEVASLEPCSVRAENGNLYVEGIEFEDRTKINFHIPLGNAAAGKGSLIAQSDRNRLLYNFDIIDVLENTEDYALIQVSGWYKINTGEKKSETAVIYLDKRYEKVNVYGVNINAADMNVYFMKWCEP